MSACVYCDAPYMERSRVGKPMKLTRKIHLAIAQQAESQYVKHNKKVPAMLSAHVARLASEHA